MNLQAIKLTTILNYDCVDREKKYLAEGGIKGTMDMLVKGKQLSFTGIILSPFDFLIDNKDFVAKVSQINLQENKEMLKTLVTYFESYCSKDHLIDFLRADPHNVPEGVKAEYQSKSQVVFDMGQMDDLDKT